MVAGAARLRRQENPEFPAKGEVASAQRVTITSGGVQREYLVQPVAGSGLHPVVIVLHGGTQDAEHVWRQTSLPTLGRRDGFVVVAPNAIGGHWNDGRGTVLGGKASTADDVGFLKDVIRDVVARDQGDPKAVFLVGASNGGFMTMHFACRAGSLLHAAAYGISDLPRREEAGCGAPPMPWLAMNGTEDPIVPFAGMAEGTMKNGERQPELLSADATFRFWARRNGCASEAEGRRLPHLDEKDPTWAEERVCKSKAGADSVQYVFHGAGHSLPNLQYGALIRRVVGESNQDVDAGEAIWGFFRSMLRR